MFLSTVHPNATFSDLNVGVSPVHPVKAAQTLADSLFTGREKLKEALEKRSGALKLLVEAEWDRFVAVKAATESASYLDCLNGQATNCVDNSRV